MIGLRDRIEIISIRSLISQESCGIGSLTMITFQGERVCLFIF